MNLNLKALINKLVNTPMVVEEGTSGIWTYRKWSSGIAECWGYTSTSATSGYTSLTLIFPFAFANTNYVVNVLGANNVNASTIVIAENNYASANLTRTTTSTMVSVYKTGNAYAQGLNVYVIGKWK